MNLLRLLIIALVVWLAIQFLRPLLRRSSPPGTPAQRDDMVRCAGCGLYLPQSEAVAADNRYFCCEDHRRRAARS